MQIAISGTGGVGVRVGQGLADAGHAVTLASRDPQASEIDGLPVAGYAAALESADVVVNALPGHATLDFYTALGPEATAGKVLVDLTNALTSEHALMYPNGSLGQQLQDALPGTRVVKALNTVFVEHMVSPGALAATSSVFLAGDDAEAKETVRTLLVDVGWDAGALVDLGPIAAARACEHAAYLLFAIMQATGTRAFNIAVAHGA